MPAVLSALKVNPVIVLGVKLANGFPLLLFTS